MKVQWSGSLRSAALWGIGSERTLEFEMANGLVQRLVPLWEGTK